jgi:ferredoxin
MIDQKARLISDLFCDGLGACLGDCPVGAITIEEREAQPYDERIVMENIIKQGPNVIEAHLKHLKDHGDHEHFQQAVQVLKEKGKEDIVEQFRNKVMSHEHAGHSGCPGSRMMDFSQDKNQPSDNAGKRASELRQWPVQLHLVSPLAPYYQKRDVLLAADCVAYTLGDFHKDYLRDKGLAIACPKLDSDMEVYIEKIKQLIDEAKINTLTVMIMEVPCCGGLLQMALEGARQATRKIPIKMIMVSLRGEIQHEEWVKA